MPAYPVMCDLSSPVPWQQSERPMQWLEDPEIVLNSTPRSPGKSVQSNGGQQVSLLQDAKPDFRASEVGLSRTPRSPRRSVPSTKGQQRPLLPLAKRDLRTPAPDIVLSPTPRSSRRSVQGIAGQGVSQLPAAKPARKSMTEGVVPSQSELVERGGRAGGVLDDQHMHHSAELSQQHDTYAASPEDLEQFLLKHGYAEAAHMMMQNDISWDAFLRMDHEDLKLYGMSEEDIQSLRPCLSKERITAGSNMLTGTSAPHTVVGQELESASTATPNSTTPPAPRQSLCYVPSVASRATSAASLAASAASLTSPPSHVSPAAQCSSLQTGTEQKPASATGSPIEPASKRKSPHRVAWVADYQPSRATGMAKDCFHRLSDMVSASGTDLTSTQHALVTIQSQEQLPLITELASKNKHVDRLQLGNPSCSVSINKERSISKERRDVQSHVSEWIGPPPKADENFRKRVLSPKRKEEYRISGKLQYHIVNDWMASLREPSPFRGKGFSARSPGDYPSKMLEELEHAPPALRHERESRSPSRQWWQGDRVGGLAHQWSRASPSPRQRSRSLRRVSTQDFKDFFQNR